MLNHLQYIKKVEHSQYGLLHQWATTNYVEALRPTHLFLQSSSINLGKVLENNKYTKR